MASCGTLPIPLQFQYTKNKVHLRIILTFSAYNPLLHADIFNFGIQKSIYYVAEKIDLNFIRRKPLQVYY